MAQPYKLALSGIIRTADGAHIPSDPENIDYAGYLAWVAEGNAPAPADVTPFAGLAATYMSTVRAIRESVLNRLSGIGMSAIAAGDGATADSIIVARQALLDITRAPAVLLAKDMDELKTAVLAEYRRIAAATPADVQRAFAGVDL